MGPSAAVTPVVDLLHTGPQSMRVAQLRSRSCMLYSAWENNVLHLPCPAISLKSIRKEKCCCCCCCCWCGGLVRAEQPNRRWALCASRAVVLEPGCLVALLIRSWSQAQAGAGNREGQP